MKLKSKRHKFIKRKVYIIILIIFIIIFLFIRLTNNIGKFFLNYAKEEAIKLTTVVINSSVKEDVYQNFDMNNLFIITKNGENEIEMIDYNSVTVNLFLDKITNEIQLNLLKLQNGTLNISEELKSDSGVFFNIPFGIIFDNPIFNNLGPNIPVRMKLIGSLLTNINVKITEYGINNAFIEMTVFIEVKEKILLPLLSDEILITNEVPVSFKIINGKIPSYYGNSYDRSSSIYSLPLE